MISGLRLSQLDFAASAVDIVAVCIACVSIHLTFCASAFRDINLHI